MLMTLFYLSTAGIAAFKWLWKSYPYIKGSQAKRSTIIKVNFMFRTEPLWIEFNKSKINWAVIAEAGLSDT
jgi:hypothetical protein